MLELKDIKELNAVNHLPKDINCNQRIILDTRLFKVLLGDDDAGTGNVKYDFEVFLPDYGINLQRGYVWKHHQQNDFILSLMSGRPIESLVVVQHEEKEDGVFKRTNFIIDGKQRLLTIRKFLHNDFSVKVNGSEYFWEDFSEEMKNFFRRCVDSLTATVFYSDWMAPMTDEMKIRLFNYYNFSGTPQDEVHKIKLQNLLDGKEEELFFLKKRGSVSQPWLNHQQVKQLTDIANSLAEKCVGTSLVVVTTAGNVTFDL